LYQKLSKSVNFSLRYTKSNLGNCYTVRIISVTAASEQHKLSKSDVVEKVIHVADFGCLLMTHAKNCKNWWMHIKVGLIVSQTWDIF